MSNQQKDYIIVYDIQEAKRLRLVANLLKAYGIRVQKSVFECPLDARQLNNLKTELEKIILEQDSIRFYSLTKRAKQEVIILGENVSVQTTSNIVVI